MEVSKILDSEMAAAGERAGERAGEIISDRLERQVRTIAYDPAWQQQIAQKVGVAAAQEAGVGAGTLVLVAAIGFTVGFWFARRTTG